MTVNSATDPVTLERRLFALLDETRVSDSETGRNEIQSLFETIANILRSQNGTADYHSLLGGTDLPHTLNSYLSLALHDSNVPGEKYASLVYQLLRVTANFCMNHDENRGRLLEVGLPQAIVSLLEGYAESIAPPIHSKPLDLPVIHLQIIRNSIGALLNLCIGYDAVQFRLISLEAPMTVLKLSKAIYPTGYWLGTSVNSNVLDSNLAEEWATRSGVSNWAWRIISELKDVKDDTLQIFTPDVLPLLVSPLLAFLPESPLLSSALSDSGSELATDLLNIDFDDLEESCTLIESLALDVEDIRLSLARGLHFPAEHNGVPCLSIILDFIEHGTYPTSWGSAAFDESERKRKEKAFDICKAALIKAVVEVAGEESNDDVLWDDSEPEKPGGDFVYRMVDWLKRYVNDMAAKSTDHTPDVDSLSGREDMVICATLALGNLSRREKNATSLISPPYSVAPILASDYLLAPSVDIKVKHGVLGLLKHLAQAPPRAHTIHNALGKAGVVRRVAASGVWDEKADAMADIVQLSAIGVVKHMCNANVEHTYALVLPSNQSPSSSTGLAQVLALIKRTDSVPVKSEGSRVLVNVVKSLWSNNLPASPSVDHQPSPIAAGTLNKEDILEKQRKRNAAIRVVLTPECASVLSNLVGRSGKYPLLVNEGLVALSLLSTQKEGGSLVLDALFASLGPELPSDSTSPPTTGTTSHVSSPTSATHPGRSHLNVPHQPFDMLVFILKNVDNPVNFPVEVRVNVCSFLIQLSKHTSGEQLDKVKAAVRPVLEILKVSQMEEMLEKAIQRLLDAWQ